MVPGWFWDEVRGEEVDKDYRSWTSAIFPNPLDVAPPPVDGFHYVVADPEEEGYNADDFGVTCILTGLATLRPYGV